MIEKVIKQFEHQIERLTPELNRYEKLSSEDKLTIHGIKSYYHLKGRIYGYESAISRIESMINKGEFKVISIKKTIPSDVTKCNKVVTIFEQKMATLDHRRAVVDMMNFLSRMMRDSADTHDCHKFETIDMFHKAFLGGFKDEAWWNEHKKERHHLPEELEDVNLVDVLEYICDCVSAGLAGTGKVTPLAISNETLQKAFQNTAKLLIENTKVEE